MKRNRKLAGAVLLALGLQATLVAAQDIDLAAEMEAARPLVSLDEHGLSFEAPAMEGLVTMKVRVFTADGELIYSTRSAGEPVDLRAIELPDGWYRYEAVNVYRTLAVPAGEGASRQGETEGISRNFGRFLILDGTLHQENLDDSQAGIMETVRAVSLAAAGRVLSLIVSDAAAADLLISDADPDLVFDDTSIGDARDWEIEGSQLHFRVQDSHVDGNFSVPFIIEPYNGTNTANTNESIRINSIGDITWGNGAMFLDKSTMELALGTNLTPSDLNLYSTIPDIRLHDETDDSWVDLQLNAGLFEIFAETTTSPFRAVVGIDVLAPEDSLVIDDSGVVSSVTAFSAPLLYAINDGEPAILMANTVSNESNVFNISGTTYGQGPFAANFPIFAYDLDAPENSIYIASNGNVGFGTDNPFQAVEVARDGAARFAVTSYTSTPEESAQYIMRRARGTEAAPTAVQTNDNLGLFSFRGHNGVNMGGSRAAITAQAAGNFTNSSTPTRLIFATTPVGSTTPQQVMVINANGTVSINGQNLNVPDYVFEDDYPLMSLDELRRFIEANKHLPGVAPAREVNAEGLDIAGAQLSVLEKVEELTLYTLQQHDEIGSLRSENASLRGELAAVREHQASLQAQLGRIEDLERLVGLLMEGHGEAELFTALTR